jgi:hypothetical protein
MTSFVLDVAPQGSSFKLSWTIMSPGEDSLTPEAYLVEGGELIQAAVNVRGQLRQIALMGDKGSPAEFAPLLKRLARYGQILFLQLMPSDPNTGEVSEIQQQLEDAIRQSGEARSDLKVRLATDQLFVPWGFVFSGRKEDLPETPKLSIADMKGFWLAHFRISVVYGGDAKLPLERKTQSCPLFALHQDLFGLAAGELDKQSAERLDILLASKPEPAMDWDTFEEVWTQVRDDHDSVLYVFGHSDGQHVQLKDVQDDPKWVLSTADLVRFRKQRRGTASIFMLNGCRTAAPKPESQEVPISANFLKETRKPGYYGFIGTETVVSNIVACRYGTEFLWRLFKQGKSVGEAFDELLSDQTLFPHNTLYTCFADRKFRFVSAPPAGNGS